MIRDKVVVEDPFWDIRAQENALRADLEADIRDLQGAIGLAEKALALRASPGWEPFLTMMRQQLHNRTEELIGAATEREAFLLQGRVRELRSVLSLMGTAEQNVQVLRERLQAKVKERQERFLANNKVKPVGATS